MVDRLTLTVNSRLARWLQFHHGRQQSLDGQRVWNKPDIHSLDDWLRQVWLQSWPEQYVLTELQSRNLWQKIIREDPSTSHLNLLHIQGAASHASEACQLIQKYRLPDEPAGFNNYTEETRTFRRWLTRYRKQLQEWQALDPSELLDAVSLRMEQGHIPLPGEIIFHGFDEITPQMRGWLDFLESRQISIRFEPNEPAPVASNILQEVISRKQATVQKYEDANEEVTQCARWIRSVYREGKTIGIVVPQLEDYRDILEREFKAELAPASVFPWEDPHLPFNISLGTPLSHEPMVHLALLLLSQKNKRIPLLTFSTLVTSPFLNLPADEIESRRDLDWSLRGGNTTHVLITKVLSPEQKQKCPTLVAFIKDWMGWMDKESPRLPSEWAEIISDFLGTLQWPMDKQEWEELTKIKGKRDLLSRQYQAFKSWKECLDSLSSLDRVLQKINRHQAVSNLTHIAGETLFQPQTHEEPIQVIGLLESAGMEFDHLWVMGCHGETLPPIPHPNPFLPFLSHQQPYSLPHSTAERELIFTEQTLWRLAHACHEIVFSYPTWQGESEMAASPLLTPWIKDKNTIQSSVSSKVADHPGFAVQLESVEDYFPIPVLPEEKKSIKGGYSLLKNQAECPFRAFAIHRLSSKTRNFPEMDVDDSFQGTLIHKIMELFWQQARTSDTLHDLHESNKLQPLIQKCIQEAFQDSSFDADQQSAFYELEQERLTSLILEWMEKDLERSAFEVLKTEEPDEIQLDGLILKIKLDRMDKTPEGKIILIDYKTGRINPPDKWFEDRMEDPQLPLYALQVPADAVAYANVKRGEYKYKGIAVQDNLIPRLESDLSRYNPDLHSWKELSLYWKENLSRTAQEFLAGHLKVDPLNAPDTCRYCDQITLCRKTELLNPFNGEAE